MLLTPYYNLAKYDEINKERLRNLCLILIHSKQNIFSSLNSEYRYLEGDKLSFARNEIIEASINCQNIVPKLIRFET